MTTTTTSTSAQWRANFETHRGQHRDLTMPPRFQIDEHDVGPLAESLAVFQLGETGEGSRLFAAAEREGVDDDQMQALKLFIGEEQEHARLLEKVLDRLGAPTRGTHWTDEVFVWARQLFGYRGEVLMLLVAEVTAFAYYAALRDGIDDPDLADVFGRIHADEVRHIDFHAATLPAYLATWRKWQWWLGRIIWNTTVAGTSVVVAMGHRRALQCASSSGRHLVKHIHTIRKREDERFFRR